MLSFGVGNLAEKKICTGCGACYNKCPQDAIAMVFDDEGFRTPRIESEKCVECGLCEKACPVLRPVKLERMNAPDVYACWSNDERARYESSSGGMFSVYANRLLVEGGVVFGVALDREWRATFVKVESSDALAKLRSSKYVQADTGRILREVERELKSGRKVLFSGTPCQVAGLYTFLEKPYKNLFTCDLICHGVPSPALFGKWVKRLEREYAGKILSINLRGKQGNWPRLVVVLYVDSRPDEPIILPWTHPLADYVGKAFMKDISLRSSCSRCLFATLPRVGDVTLGDFWGIGREIAFPYDVKDGISLNMINSEQGKHLVEMCREDATWVKRDLQEAKNGNSHLSSPSVPHPKRGDFLRDAIILDYEQLTRRHRVALNGTFFQRVKKRTFVFIRRLLGEGGVKRIKRLLKMNLG